MKKTVLIHDWLEKNFGAEKVLSALHSCYPAPIYTLIHSGFDQFPYPDIRTSFLQKISTKHFRKLLPLFPKAIESFDLSEYDLILSSSHAVAKSVKKQAHQLHICYCHTPMRYAWDEKTTYASQTALPWAFSILMEKMRMWDKATSKRVDHFIANSEFIAERIYRCYNRRSKVIYPPVDIAYFDVCRTKDDYYITSGRDAPYKRLDLINYAFAKMKRRKLVLIENLTRAELREKLQGAKAYISMAKEDFGILPVEAMACGTPIIGYGHGGLKETVGEVGGILFENQTDKALIEAIETFETKDFPPDKLHEHAQKFSKERFEEEIKAYVESCYHGWRTGESSLASILPKKA